MPDENVIKPRYLNTEEASIYSGLSISELDFRCGNDLGPTFVKLHDDILYDV